MPGGPIWVSAPGAFFGEVSSLPSGSRLFLSPLRDTQRATFTLGTAAPLEPARFELRLDASCRSLHAAAEIARQLTDSTGLLRSMLSRDKLAPNPADLSGVLTSGRFEAQGTRVSGLWGIDRKFLDTLVSGQLR